MRSGVVMMIVFVALSLVSRASAQCELAWDPQFGSPGANGEITCAAVYDSGHGLELYVGGSFTVIGGVNAQYVAKSDGETWSPVGAGVDNAVYALAVYNGELYVAGGFSTAGGSNIPKLAKWNGSSWSAPAGGAFNVEPNFLHVTSAPTGTPRMYAGGQFTSIGGNTIKGLAVFDGVTWSSVGGAEFTNGTRVIAFDDPLTPASDLFIGGKKILPGGALEDGVFGFDGTTFSNKAPGGTSGFGIFGLEVFDDGSGPCLFIGGDFSSIAGVPARRIAQWNGSFWSEPGGGVTSDTQNFVRDLAVWDDGSGPALFVGGKFQTAGSTPVKNIARWSGQAWSALTTGVSENLNDARALFPFDTGGGEGLVVVGNFIKPLPYIAMWTGLNWTGVGKQNGMGGTRTIKDFVVYDDSQIGPELIAGGNFTTAGPTALQHIAGWDGRQWRSLGPGFNQEVRSLVVHDDGTSGPCVYACGGFSSLLDGSLQNLLGMARWDGAQWHSVLNAASDSIGGQDMTVFDDGGGEDIYVIGNSAAYGFGAIARLDGDHLTQLGASLNRTIYCIAVFNDGSGDALYVGCESTLVGAVADDCLLKWNGTAWMPVGGGLQKANARSSVWALKSFVHNGVPTLAVGGDFDGPGALASRSVAFWNGANWSAPPGPQPTAGIVASFGLHDDGTGTALYAASLNVPSTAFYDTLVKLTRTGWTPLAYGIGGGVNAMQSFDPDGGASLYAGGTTVLYWTTPAQSSANGEYVRSYGIMRWHTCLDDPGFLDGPDDQSVPLASNVAFSVQATGGDLSYRWRRDSVPLNNNVQQSGVDSPRLTLYAVNAGDEGDYDVIVTNAAGFATSTPGTLTVIEPCVGDIVPLPAGDGMVNVADLLAVITNWGACGNCSACPADIAPAIHDCAVNVADLLSVITHWGACP